MKFSEPARIKDLQWEIKRLNELIDGQDKHIDDLNRLVSRLCRHIDKIENWLDHFAWFIKQKVSPEKAGVFRSKLLRIARKIRTPLMPTPYKPKRYEVHCCNCGRDFSISYTPALIPICPSGCRGGFWIDKHKSPSSHEKITDPKQIPTLS